MRERIIEVKVVKKQFCYKEVKAKSGTVREEGPPVTPECPFGKEKYEDTCINCRFYADTILSSEVIGEMKSKEGEEKTAEIKETN